MARISILVLALNGLLLASAVPQYGPGGAGNGGGNYNNQGNQGGSPPPPPPPPPQQQQQSYGQQQSGGQQGGSSSGSSSSGGDLSVQCKASPDGSGKIKYDCSGVNKDAITLKTEHFLWLENQASTSQDLDIEIPNYNIDEFIKAAYKALGPQEGAKINIVLKKPQVTYNAEKDEGKNGGQSPPAVSVNYQPVDKVSVHYPTQKAYGNSGVPAPQPPQQGGNQGGNQGQYSQQQQQQQSSSGGGSQGAYSQQQSSSSGGPGAYSRPQRESGFKYYFIRQ